MTDMAGDIEKALRIISDDMAENGTGFRTDPHQIEAAAIRQGAELITRLRAQVEAANALADHVSGYAAWHGEDTLQALAAYRATGSGE